MKIIQVAIILLICSIQTLAGNQQEQALSTSVQSVLKRSILAHSSPSLSFLSTAEKEAWFNTVSPKLNRRIPDEFIRKRLLTAIYYEAARAGLEPQLILGIIHVESNFRPYAISSVGARGLMQVMPFWQRLIGKPEQSLFDIYTNLRYGCTILRHYLDIEQGNLFRALARYNGSLGSAQYPNMVLAASRYYFYSISHYVSGN